MTTITLHPSLDPADGIRMLRTAADGAVLEVNGITTIADIRTVQAWADAAEVTVWWKLHHTGSQRPAFVRVEHPQPAAADPHAGMSPLFPEWRP